MNGVCIITALQKILNSQHVWAAGGSIGTLFLAVRYPPAGISPQIHGIAWIAFLGGIIVFLREALNSLSDAEVAKAAATAAASNEKAAIANAGAAPTSPAPAAAVTGAAVVAPPPSPQASVPQFVIRS